LLFLITLQLPQHNIVANYNPQLCSGNGKDKKKKINKKKIKKKIKNQKSKINK